MKMKHLIIEGFCDGCNKKEIRDIYPCKGKLKLGLHCFECSQFSYTYCPNEIALSDADGIVKDWIGFGGSMEPEQVEKRNEYIGIWNEICKMKINEAYEQFLEKIQQIN